MHTYPNIVPFDGRMVGIRSDGKCTNEEHLASGGAGATAIELRTGALVSWLVITMPAAHPGS